MILKKVADLIALMVSENLRETISFTCIKLRKAAPGGHERDLESLKSTGTFKPY